MDLYKKGFVKAHQIFTYIEAWRNDKNTVSCIQEYLGMSRKQFSHWQLTGEIV